MRIFASTCCCSGRTTCRSAWRFCSVRTAESANKKSGRSSFRRFPSRAQFCWSNGQWQYRTTKSNKNKIRAQATWLAQGPYSRPSGKARGGWSTLVFSLIFILHQLPYFLKLEFRFRSYLHFSQLSAWYSSHRGQQPQNVLYRITIPGETFASKFSCRPEHHSFPSASKFTV